MRMFFAHGGSYASSGSVLFLFLFLVPWHRRAVAKAMTEMKVLPLSSPLFVFHFHFKEVPSFVVFCTSDTAGR